MRIKQITQKLDLSAKKVNFIAPFLKNTQHNIFKANLNRKESDKLRSDITNFYSKIKFSFIKLVEQFLELNK